MAKGYTEALCNLDSALGMAEDRIHGSPLQGQRAPRPYPRLVREGVLWIEQRPYWIAYHPARPVVIVAVFYASNDMPGGMQAVPK